MYQLEFAFAEAASPTIETLLSTRCEFHSGTTLDSTGTCPVCELEAAIRLQGTSPRHGWSNCDGCGAAVQLVTNPRDLVLVLCAQCNNGTAIR